MYKVKYGVLPQSALNYTAGNDTNLIHFTPTFSYFTCISFRTNTFQIHSCSWTTVVGFNSNCNTEFNWFWFV